MIIHNTESLRQYETYKLLWYFVIQTDHLISARRPDLVIVTKKEKKKRTCRVVDFTVPADHRVKLKESEKRVKYQDIARELKRLHKKKVTVIPVVIVVLDTVTKRLVQGLEDLETRRSRDHPNYSIIKIGQNTEKCPGDLRILAVTHNPVIDHQ